MVIIKSSKPITELKKGDKIRINDRGYEIDANILLIEHKDTKEMALEIFDAKTDKDFQMRYFTHDPENSMELFELKNEFIYIKSKEELKSAEW